MEESTQKVWLDLSNENANMYGCLPCPKCGSKYRWPTQELIIECDECGFTEEYEEESL